MDHICHKAGGTGKSPPQVIEALPVTLLESICQPSAKKVCYSAALMLAAGTGQWHLQRLRTESCQLMAPR